MLIAALPMAYVTLQSALDCQSAGNPAPLACLPQLEYMRCFLQLLTYAIELGWRAEMLRDPAILVVRDAIISVF